MDRDKIEIVLENGDVIELTVDGSFKYNGKEYIVLYDEETEDIYIYEMIDDGYDEFTLENVPDEEFDGVMEEFTRIIESYGTV